MTRSRNIEEDVWPEPEPRVARGETVRPRPIEEDIWPAPEVVAPKITRRHLARAAIMGFLVGASAGWMACSFTTRSENTVNESSNTGTATIDPLLAFARELAPQPPSTWTRKVGQYCRALDRFPEDEILWRGVSSMCQYLASDGDRERRDHVSAGSAISNVVRRLDAPSQLDSSLSASVERLRVRLGL